MNRKLIRAFIKQRFIVALMLIAQIVALVAILLSSSEVSFAIQCVLFVLSAIAILHVISKKEKGAYKLTWVFLILLLPVLGGLLYVMFQAQLGTKRFAKNIDKTTEKVNQLIGLQQCDNKEVYDEIPHHLHQVKYLQKHTGFPIYKNSRTTYLSPGEKKFEYLLEEIKKAEKYIFLEYFIIEEGIMWDAILEVLKEKASQGVKVRLIYDDMGCFVLLPKNYPKQLEKLGIECKVFNPFRPFLTVMQNNRDHRKIVSIDGKVAFTGGINLADEYINAYEKHGHWKDSSVMVEGKAAWSFTLMFLQMWELCTNIKEDYYLYYPWKDQECLVDSTGFVQPYCDSPMDKENVGEHVYLQIINNAKKYVYINTPYLIVDDSMVSALTLAAKSGIDVRIVTPHIWDKWVVHVTTRSYYQELIAAGVKVYEYTKGFMHSKTFISDDETATIGTINMDFRSLYLHFECGTLLFKSEAVMEAKEDFLETLKSCQKITLEDCRCNLLMRIFRSFLRIFAPLM